MRRYHHTHLVNFFRNMKSGYSIGCILSIIILISCSFIVYSSSIIHNTFPFVNLENINISDTAFSYQTLCVHHDNFHRIIPQDSWHIGDNGDDIMPMKYCGEDVSNDDGFRLINNKVVNTRKCKVRYGIRLIESEIGEHFYTEIAYPEKTNNHQSVVCCDGNNKKDLITIDTYLKDRETLVFKKEEYRKGKIISNNTILTTNIIGNNIKYEISKSQIKIYIDNNLVLTQKSFLKYNPRVGILVSKKYDYSYKMFNVFNIEQQDCTNPSSLIDSGKINNKYSKNKEQIVSEYAHCPEKNIAVSGMSERFELRFNDATIPTSPRSEVNVVPTNRHNLRRFIISFDVFIPNDYISDEYFDVLMQIHDTPADNRTDYKLNPNIALRTKDDYWYLTINGDPGTGDFSTKKYKYMSVNKLERIKKQQWTHMEIRVKEGYMVEHNPYLEFWIDDKLTLKTIQPNCYNHPRGSYFKYGIYKSDWAKGNRGSAKERVVYFDNFLYKL